MTYLADGAFDVIERRIPLHPDNHVYREMELETKPQQSWTAVFEASRRGWRWSAPACTNRRSEINPIARWP